MTDAAAGAIYDRIGRGYAGTRRPDPRIERQIRDALGDVSTLVNVGAGAGSYEPDDLRVVAVEPSWEMIGQRRSRDNVVQGHAEALPFADDSFDAALASLTLHHWSDVAQGLAELRRVVTTRIVIFTHRWDQITTFWLVDEYFPEIVAEDQVIFPTIDELAASLDVTGVEPVNIPNDCVDGFLAAFWNRPDAYLDPGVRAGISGLAKLDDALVAERIARLSDDLSSGRWDERHGHLRSESEQDYGYRLVVANA